MGNFADRLTNLDQLKPMVLIDELQSTGELMLRIKPEILKKLESDVEASLSVVLLVDMITASLGLPSLQPTVGLLPKMSRPMDNFVPRVSFERFQQKLEQNATKLGLKKPSSLMKTADDLREGLYGHDRPSHQLSAHQPARKLESRLSAIRDSARENKLQATHSRDDTLSYAEEELIDHSQADFDSNRDCQESYQTPMENTRKLIAEFRKPEPQVSDPRRSSGKILSTLVMARSRSRPTMQERSRDDKDEKPKRVFAVADDYDKENYESYNAKNTNVDLNEVRLSNESFGPSKSYKRDLYHTEYDKQNYESSHQKRPFFRGRPTPADETDYDTGSVMPGDLWTGSRISSNTRQPARDDSQFYSHMSEAESRCLEWE